ncbi:SRPBCC domain-containing protein [Microbacterium sp. NPDC089695]|uniref:SRPBCC family protein n=1 Tax=Microbacterium sp. NPDC089695 TaxID=3364198 RepID=UPI003816129D
MTDTPRIRVTIAAPPDQVWDALRDRDRIRHWHGWEFDGGPDGSLDQEIETIYFTDVEVGDGALVLNGGDRVDVEEVDGGTRVTLTRAEPSGDPEWDAYYDDITEGWTTFLHQLRFAVERHPKGTRHTVVLRGLLADDPSTALDAFPDGSASRTVWFRSAHQTGLAVDAWGPGLAIISHDPATRATMVLLSLYDLAPDRVENIRAQWSAWWHERLADDRQSKEP